MNLKSIWNVEGENPEYHRKQKERLKREWPLLYMLLNRLSEDKKQECSHEHSVVCESRTEKHNDAVSITSYTKIFCIDCRKTISIV